MHPNVYLVYCLTYTAPGSQNGFDNSGRLGPIDWEHNPTFISQTLIALKNLTTRYRHDTDVVSAIELLNEPANWGLDMDTLKRFYYDGLRNVRHANRKATVVIHDAYKDIMSYWNGFMNSTTGVKHIILDTHVYQIFTHDLIALKPCSHVQTACNMTSRLKGTDKWTIVGEWTGAQTDCAKWLNGLGKGARYDKTLSGSNGYHGDCQTKYQGTVDDLLDTDKTNLEYFVEAQMDAYEAHTGWIFWTWKTESAPEWHFQNLTRAGLIPQPLTSRKHPGQCRTSECLIPRT